LIIITFISATMVKIFNEEISLYITSALIFICGTLNFFPLWIAYVGSIFGIIIAILAYTKLAKGGSISGPAPSKKEEPPKAEPKAEPEPLEPMEEVG